MGGSIFFKIRCGGWHRGNVPVLSGQTMRILRNDAVPILADGRVELLESDPVLERFAAKLAVEKMGSL
jgi:hypothetical protein